MRVRDEIVKHFKGKSSVLQDLVRSPKIVFLCGGADPSSDQSIRARIWTKVSAILCKTPVKVSSNRAILEEYFQTTPQKILTFRAEDAWQAIEREFGDLSALEHEAKLALSSDAIVIIVESIGTAAELGAFALSRPLRERLLLVLGQEFENHQSFVNTGPVRWTNASSLYRPAIYADLNDILSVAPNIEKRLNRPSLGRLHLDSWEKSRILSPKERLFVLVKLVFLLAPVQRHHLNYYLREIFGYEDDKEVAFSLSLAVALRLIYNAMPEGYFSPFFYCSSAASLKRFTTSRHQQSLSSLRARILEPLRQIDVYRNVDHQVRSIHANRND